MTFRTHDYHHLHPSPHRVRLHRPVGCGCKLDGTDTRVWPGHSRVTPGRFPPSVLELRHAASLADNWFRARRDEMKVRPTRERKRKGCISVTFRLRVPELKSFHRRNNLPRSPLLRFGRRKGCTGQPLLRLRRDRSHRRREAIAVWRIQPVLYPSTESWTKRKLYRASSADVKKVNCRKIHG